MSLLIHLSLLAQDNPFQVVRPPSPTITSQETPPNTLKATSTVSPAFILPTSAPLGSNASTASEEDLGNLTLSMLEANYELLQNNENKFILTTALDRVVNDLCLKPLIYLNEKSTHPKCPIAISKLRKLDSLSPSLACVDNGFASPACAKAYSLQLSIIYEEQSVIRTKSLDEKFGSNSQRKIRARSSELSLSTSLKDYCSMILIAPVDGTIKTNPTAEIATPSPTQENKDMNEVLSALSVTTENTPIPDNNPTPSQHTHFRILSQECMDAIQENLKEQRNVFEATCFLHGFYSPNCMAAKQKFDLTKPTATPLPGVTPGKEFAVF